MPREKTKMKKERKEKVTLSITPYHNELINLLGEKYGMNRSQIVETAIQNFELIVPLLDKVQVTK